MRALKVGVVSLLLLIGVEPGTADDDRRYVTSDPRGGAILWTSWSAFNACERALTPQSRRLFCEDGFAGQPPRVGVLDSGTPVEVLEDGECRTLAHVRVLAGRLAGSVGCIAAQRLTTIKPDTTPAAGSSTPRPRQASRRLRQRTGARFRAV
jgi:hypothetical protein